jgi:hypothetical protein
MQLHLFLMRDIFAVICHWRRRYSDKLRMVYTWLKIFISTFQKFPALFRKLTQLSKHTRTVYRLRSSCCARKRRMHDHLDLLLNLNVTDSYLPFYKYYVPLRLSLDKMSRSFHQHLLIYVRFSVTVCLHYSGRNLPRQLSMYHYHCVIYRNRTHDFCSWLQRLTIPWE